MAVTVIVGLMFSTLLAPLFVPTLFSAINSVQDRIRRALVTVPGTNQPRMAE